MRRILVAVDRRMKNAALITKCSKALAQHGRLAQTLCGEVDKATDFHSGPAPLDMTR
jgi:hypothetical protein